MFGFHKCRHARVMCRVVKNFVRGTYWHAFTISQRQYVARSHHTVCVCSQSSMEANQRYYLAVFAESVCCFVYLPAAFFDHSFLLSSMLAAKLLLSHLVIPWVA
ncbi:hypothetical protein Plhal710r2_c007g0033031 [Plasmopara halstedii]